MRGVSRALAILRDKTAVTYSLADLGAVFVMATVVALWVAAAGGAFSPLVLLATAAALLSFYMAGSFVAGWARLSEGLLFDLPLRVLVGYAIVNTALLLFAWLSPLGIVGNFSLLFALAALLFLAARPVRKPWREGHPGLLALALTLLATSLWCQDLFNPVTVEQNLVVWKPWVDGFYHSVYIRNFSTSHGHAFIEDFRMAGVPARLYHYASYLTPALVAKASGLHSYIAFAGILAPVGVLFTGLGAYAFIGSLWGAWPGLAACAALLVLPDATQQGLPNTYLSYHWLTQIAPGTTYGIAMLAAAWLLVIVGCTRGSFLQILAGWVLGVLSVLYKAQFFFASAHLLLLVPPLFYAARLGLRRRLLWAVASVAAYAAAIIGTRNVAGLPMVRFDFSSMGQMLDIALVFTRPGAIGDFLYSRIGHEYTWTSNLLLGGPYALLAVLGLFAPLAILLALRLRKDTPPLLLLFPFLLMANFVAMFLGMALDFRETTPDELSHRPFVVMYFFVVAWTGGAAGLLLMQRERLARFAPLTLMGVALVLLVIPAHFGPGVQRQWGLPRISPPLRIPIGQYRAAEYLRDHADPQDIFQDSQCDMTYVVASVSGLRSYVSRSLTRVTYNLAKVNERVSSIWEFMEFRNPASIALFAKKTGIRWFLLQPGDRVLWPAEIADKPVFEMNGFKLYRF
jgi:hypothetical protein